MLESRRHALGTRIGVRKYVGWLELCAIYPNRLTFVLQLFQNVLVVKHLDIG